MNTVTTTTQTVGIAGSMWSKKKMVGICVPIANAPYVRIARGDAIPHFMTRTVMGGRKIRVSAERPRECFRRLAVHHSLGAMFPGKDESLTPRGKFNGDSSKGVQHEDHD